jgi:signal transduction histidine kinase
MTGHDLVLRYFTARNLIRFGSLVLISSGIGALFGWAFHWRGLLQLLRETPFITCDTACTFIVAGAGLWCASSGAFFLARLLGILLIVLGAVYLTASILGFWLSLHSFFMEATAAVVFPWPVRSTRMAGATALVFLLLGILLVLLSQRRPGLYAMNAAAILAGAIPSIGILGILISTAGVASEHGWTALLAKMAVLTSISIFFAGASACALFWLRSGPSQRNLSRTAVSLALIGVAILFLGIDSVVVANADAALSTREHLDAMSSRISLIRDIVRAVRRAESGQRGFLLTGSRAYLKDYDGGLLTVKAGLQVLREDSEAERQIEALRVLINQKMAELAATINLERTRQRAESVAIVNSGRGLLLMSGIDEEADRLAGGLEAQLREHLTLNEQAQRLTKRTVVFSFAIAVLMIGLGYGLLRAEIRRRAKIESALRESELSLEGRNIQIEKRTAELQAANKELEEFAYAASHDLKAPLRVIENASKWLEEDLAEHLSDETRENMNLLRGRVKRMQKLLDDLLEYARIGHGTDERFAEIVTGEELMDNIVALLSPADFKVKVSPSFRGIRVRRMPLQQILMNLIGNAIKHHDKKEGCVEVSVEQRGGQYSFAVKDDGPGIPARFHDQIFQMFQTLRSRDQVEGSGMGLAMVRKNVEVFGGKLQLESGEGQGSTFRFTWPKDQETKGKAA